VTGTEPVDQFFRDHQLVSGGLTPAVITHIRRSACETGLVRWPRSPPYSASLSSDSDADSDPIPDSDPTPIS